MYDLIAWAVVAVAALAIFDKHIPTGVLGSFGLAVIGGAALVAVDDSSFANVARLEGAVVAFMLGFLAIATHLVLMAWRSRTGRMTRRRRTTDWQEFDAEDTRPMERA